MKKVVKLNESQVRELINNILVEEMMSTGEQSKSSVDKRPGGPPNLKGFKADCNMMADAAARVKEILDAGRGNTREAIRWLEKVIHFATSAKKTLGL